MCADGIKSIFFLLSVGGIWVLYGRGEHCSPAKYHKVTFPLSYFCMTKSTKSQQGGLAPSSFQTTAACTSYSQEVVRGEYVRHRSNVKVGGFAAPHGFSYTTRANISHERTEQIRARIVRTPA